MKKILIFGATGHIGAYTSVFLKKMGYTVIASGKRISDNGFFISQGIEYISVDVSSADQFQKFNHIKDIDTVVFLAGNAPSKMKGYNPQYYIDMFVTGTLNVLNFCVSNKIEKFIFTQSRADSNYLMGSTTLVPADIMKKFPLTGDHSIYSICKNTAVDLIEHFYNQHGLKRFVFRLPTIYGYHPDKYFYVDGAKKMMSYRIFMEKALKGEPIEIWGDPMKKKEIVYIKDLSTLIQHAIESDKDGGMYNFGRGEGISLEEQVKGIIDVFSKNENKSEIVYKPDNPNSRQFIHDVSKTKEELGFQVEFNYWDLLRDFKKEMELNQFELLWGNPEDYD
ncbi:MAG: NAD(P)-dependent oxidoreductase [Bacteroidales bacterium]|nr:NAD(P)-dependent oxidoreductase [Bacteroidales bacterium]